MNSDVEVLGVVLIAMAFGWFVYMLFQILRSSSSREETAKEIAKRFRASLVDTAREIGQAAAVIVLFGFVILSVFQVVDLGNVLLWLFTGVVVLWVLGFFTHGK
ncbi:hypothetical protein [Sulfitobacter dubius]|uniref:hypothetical protein n=1 Tax=Sulfitobacter dubius TaxID=218673 RepID=UPI002942BB5A|nr:hypothetical protein [Sulfitobacter dubius]WOI30025.1 hypothetical protein R1T39_04800 [Sulfitobacter dubius]